MIRSAAILLTLTSLAAADTFEDLWKLPVLYQNPESDGLREFALSANLQWQWADGDSNQGDFGTRDRPDEVRWGDIEIRRMELGFKSQWGPNVKVSGTFDANPDGAVDPDLGQGFYRDLHDFSIVYSHSPALNIGAGKITTKFFTYENATSSRELIVFERSMLVENLIPKELTGLWVHGTENQWLYGMAVFAGDYQKEFSEFDAGFVTQTTIGYDFAKCLGIGKAAVKFDYQYSSSSGNTGNPGRFEHGFSFNTYFQEGPFSLYTDLLAGLGRGAQGDVIGITVTPSWHITDDLELVFRYQHANGSDDGLQLLSRYERLAPDLTDSGRGTEFDAAYLGLNYYVYGHKCKFMAGAEFQHMNGGADGGSYDGFTSLAGFRLNF